MIFSCVHNSHSKQWRIHNLIVHTVQKSGNGSLSYLWYGTVRVRAKVAPIMPGSFTSSIGMQKSLIQQQSLFIQKAVGQTMELFTRYYFPTVCFNCPKQPSQKPFHFFLDVRQSLNNWPHITRWTMCLLSIIMLDQGEWLDVCNIWDGFANNL